MLENTTPMSFWERLLKLPYIFAIEFALFLITLYQYMVENENYKYKMYFMDLMLKVKSGQVGIALLDPEDALDILKQQKESAKKREDIH